MGWEIFQVGASAFIVGGLFAAILWGFCLSWIVVKPLSADNGLFDILEAAAWVCLKLAGVGVFVAATGLLDWFLFAILLRGV